MKFLSAILFIFSSGLVHAAPQQPADQEVLLQVYEVSNFIVNFSPNSLGLGRVLAARCPECKTETFTFDKNTILEMGGKPIPIDEIRVKAQWSGLITVTNLEPEKIIKITLY